MCTYCFKDNQKDVGSKFTSNLLLMKSNVSILALGSLPAPTNNLEGLPRVGMRR